MKSRYLLFFSYIGTNFRGAEKIWKKNGATMMDGKSVQGAIELGLLRLKPANFPRVFLSSRTDSGVHALNATAHIDLECYGTSIYHPRNITVELNKFFRKTQTSVCINDTIRVPDYFSARRQAVSRTYLYRFAVAKCLGEDNQAPKIPIEEWNRCLFLKDKNFSIEKFIEASKYFPGYHDFRTFQKYDKVLETKSARRSLISVEVRKGKPMTTSFTERNNEILFDYWDVEFKGRGFVHNQIRRIIGVLRAVATDKILMSDIPLMLQIPSKNMWPPQAATAPPQGLYLCDVEYNRDDFVLKDDKDTCVLSEISEDEE